jgi:hypothetical protein
VANTPVYGWPYQTAADAPNGPTLGQNLALAIESTVQANDASRVSGDAALALLAPTYRARQTLGGTTAKVTFSSIPTNLRSLTLRVYARGDSAVQGVNIALQVNGNTGANYHHGFLQTTTSTSPGGTHSDTKGICGIITGASAGANVFGEATINFPMWDLNANFLSYDFLSSAMGTTTANHFVYYGGGVFTSASTRNQLDIFPTTGNFIAGSDFQLVGWGP